MPTARLVGGTPTVYEYTPDAAVDGGDVILENDVPIIMGRAWDSASTVENTPIVAHHRGGIYECTKPTGYAGDWCEAAYWNATTGITKTQSDLHFGRFVTPAASGDVLCYVLHEPVVGLLDES
jgi:hypothetical protein